jgi:antitoxin component of RelBE/YafQ-DinJ toxin-antitoxin module
MATLGLKFQHHGGEFARRRLRTSHLPTDVEVLSENATQVAACKENRAGASPAAQAVFLAMMWKVARDDSMTARLTDCELVF